MSMIFCSLYVLAVSFAGAEYNCERDTFKYYCYLFLYAFVSMILLKKFGAI